MTRKILIYLFYKITQITKINVTVCEACFRIKVSNLEQCALLKYDETVRIDINIYFHKSLIVLRVYLACDSNYRLCKKSDSALRSDTGA